MSGLSTISLNVNGLRNEKKRALLYDYIKSSKVDIVFLQETHVASVEDCILWNRDSGFKGYWSLGSSNSCGVGILMREELTCNPAARPPDEDPVLVRETNPEKSPTSQLVDSSLSQKTEVSEKLSQVQLPLSPANTENGMGLTNCQLLSNKNVLVQERWRMVGQRKIKG